jgi:cytosine/creatinine deaminase
MAETVDWLLTNVRIADDAPPLDLALADGRIVALGPALPHSANQHWDLAGRVVLPGLVDAHTHLDKTFFEQPNHSGTLLEAIEVWQAASPALTYASYHARATRALELAVQNGTTTLRTHVDMNAPHNLVALDAILAVRAQWRQAIDVQIVALGSPGVTPEYDAIMQQALDLGADVVGGAPSLEAEPLLALRGAFALAEATGKPIDLHIDETEDPRMRVLERLADLTIAHGMQGQVTAGHCCSLAFMDEATAGRIMAKVARAQIHIVTLPSCNLVLMGRGQQPVPRGLTRVAELLAHDVNVCAASDNVADPFNPFGSYDLLQIANLTAHTAHLSGTPDILACVELVSTRAAQTLGLVDYGLHVGAVADLVVTAANRLATFKRGQLVVRTTIERTWPR